MANEIKERIVFDDSAIIKSLTDQYSLVTKVNKAIRESELSYTEAFKIAKDQIDETNAATKKLNTEVGKQIVSTKTATSETRSWADAIEEVGANISLAGQNLGQFVGGLRAKITAMKASVTSVRSLSASMGVLKVAIASTGLGLLVITLGAVAAAMSRSEKVTGNFSAAMKTLNGAVTFATSRLASLGDSIIKLVKLDFKGSADSWTEAIKGFWKGLSDAGANAAAFAKKMQELNKLQSESLVTNAKIKGQVADLLLQAADRNKSLETRIELLKEVQDLEVGAADSEYRRRQSEYLAYNLFLQNKRDANEKITQEEIEQHNKLKAAAILAESAKKDVAISTQTRISGLISQENAERQAAYEAEMARIKAVNDALNDQVEKIIEAADRVHDETLDPEQRILAEANAAKSAIEDAFRVLDEKAKAAGKEVDLSREKAALLISIENHTAREIEKIRNAAIGDIEELGLKGVQSSERAAVDIVGNVQAAVQKMSDSPEVRGSLLSLSEKLQKAFDIDEDTLNGIVSGIGNVFDAVFDATNANTEAAISKNEELLDSIRERQQLLDDDLEREKERQEAGLANSLDAKAKEREILAKEEEKALKESEKLRKKQLAQQLIQDSLQQASSVGTMAANVLASPGVSLLGPAGIPIALATIAAMIGILSKIKSSSKKLYKGGPINQEGVTGFVNKNGRTDKNGGRGHAVEDSNLVLGGREFVVNEVASMKHGAFLEALNRGEFDNGDGLHFAMGHTKELEHGSAIVSAMSERRQTLSMAAAMGSIFEASIHKHIGKLIGVIEEKPDSVAYTPGQVIRKETKGKVTITQTEPDWRWKPEPRH